VPAVRAASQLAREIPWIMRNYQLDEITTRAALRRQLSDHFRRTQTTNPKVIDILLFKGQAEAHEVMAHYTQRHHLVRDGRAERGAAWLRARCGAVTRR
jgi:hypothetical protein